MIASTAGAVPARAVRQVGPCSRRNAVLTSARTAGRKVVLAAHATQGEHAAQNALPRRSVLLAVGTAAAALQARPAWCEEGAAPSELRIEETPEGLLVEGEEFSMVIPDTLSDLGVPIMPRSTAPGERGAPPPPSPVKARFSTPDRKQAVTVVVREAAALKPTFQQLRDITEWGSGAEVGRLLLPAGARQLGFESATIERPAKDTKTVRGVVDQAPVHIYKYRFLVPGDTQVSMAVGAQKGRVFVMAGQVSKSNWNPETEAQLKMSVDSFRLKNRFIPLY